MQIPVSHVIIGDMLVNNLGLTGVVTNHHYLSENVICISIDKKPGMMIDADYIVQVVKRENND